MINIANKFIFRDALKLGRSLTEGEKKIIWEELWDFVKAYEAIKKEKRPSAALEPGFDYIAPNY